VVSYEQAVRGQFEQIYDVLILDEGHYLKTPESQRTQAIFNNSTGIARRAYYKWILTGTPILNRPRELFPVLKCLAPGFADYTFPSFAQRYCGAYFDGRRINTKGASRLDELSGKLEGFMLRRTSDQVGLELPPIVSSLVPLELDAQSLSVIERAEEEISNREAFISTVMEDFSALGDQASLLHAVGFAKAVPAAHFVRELLKTQNKVVVFAHHRDVVDIIAQKLLGSGIQSVKFQGGMSDAQKASAIRLFKEDPGIQVIIGNIKAMGTGVDGLQEIAHSCVFAEITWVPDEIGQAIRRLRRMGQARDRVNAYILYAPGTLEEAVLGVHKAKSHVLQKLGLGMGWRTNTKEEARK
jgi:SWI/SNF-related matrix-associated actin-dependent regulator 1 of chromatin subfamily A